MHADRGAPLTATLVAELLRDLGVTRRASRPSIAHDHPYSEAQVTTMTYGPRAPERFASREDAQAWVSSFSAWYNTAHRHRGLGLLSPAVVHAGPAIAGSAARQHTLDAAYVDHPERFVRGRPVPAAVPEAV